MFPAGLPPERQRVGAADQGDAGNLEAPVPEARPLRLVPARRGAISPGAVWPIRVTWAELVGSEPRSVVPVARSKVGAAGGAVSSVNVKGPSGVSVVPVASVAARWSVSSRRPAPRRQFVPTARVNVKVSSEFSVLSTLENDDEGVESKPAVKLVISGGIVDGAGNGGIGSYFVRGDRSRVVGQRGSDRPAPDDRGGHGERGREVRETTVPDDGVYM